MGFLASVGIGKDCADILHNRVATKKTSIKASGAGVGYGRIRSLNIHSHIRCLIKVIVKYIVQIMTVLHCPR